MTAGNGQVPGPPEDDEVRGTPGGREGTDEAGRPEAAGPAGPGAEPPAATGGEDPGPFGGGVPTGEAAPEEPARAVRVTIFGEDYRIRTRLGEEYTRRCARHVDEAIQEAHIGGHVVEPHRAAILAAMKLTDELFRARGELERARREMAERRRAVEERVEALTRRIREALPEP